MVGQNSINILKLSNYGDERGLSYQPIKEVLGFLRSVQDLHIATIIPGASRGNHYHKEHHEVLIVIYSDKWSLHFDNGLDTNVIKKSFQGSGAVLMQIKPFASHVISNDGNSIIYMIGISDIIFDPENPDSHVRILK